MDRPCQRASFLELLVPFAARASWSCSLAGVRLAFGTNSQVTPLLGISGIFFVEVREAAPVAVAVRWQRDR